MKEIGVTFGSSRYKTCFKVSVRLSQNVFINRLVVSRSHGETMKSVFIIRNFREYRCSTGLIGIGVWGGGGLPPPDLKNFRETLFFRARASCSKILNDKKYIFNTMNSGHTLFFRASASCLKILNVKVYSNQWKVSGETLFFNVSAKLLKNPEW